MKQKTHSGAKKRFRVTGKKGSIKIVGRKAATRHLLINKKKRQKKMTGTPFALEAGDAKTIRKMLKI